MFKRDCTLAVEDSAVWSSIMDEMKRQEAHIELIASENYVSPAVLEAQGSVLTNKYAEGYPNKRFYGGCTYVDRIEQLAIDRAKTLFGAEYANVQPHSGSQANQAVYFSLLKPGDKVLGLNLSHGGHLTHGAKANLSGELYQFIPYGLNAQEEIDYTEMLKLAEKHRPALIIGGASAYALKMDWAKMRQIADAVGAFFMVDMAHYAGLIAAGVYPNPVPFADVVTTTTHKTLRGPRGGLILAKAQYEKQLNASIFPRLQGGPLMHVIAAKAVALHEAATDAFKIYQQQVLRNADTFAKTLLKRGFKIVSGRTESHLLLLDLQPQKLTGKKADAILGQAGITVNKNAIPNDPNNAFITSGIRLGTPAITTRGFKEAESTQVAHWIADILSAPEDNTLLEHIGAQVQQLTAQFPVYS